MTKCTIHAFVGVAEAATADVTDYLVFSALKERMIG